MSRPRVRVGLIGQGFIGRAHSLALGRLRQLGEPVLVPTVLCGRDHDRLEPNARRWGFDHVTTDWREVVTSPDVDLVAILTPNHLHHPIALAAFQEGKAVVCEKPLAATLADSREMTAAAARAGQLHACSFNYRFVPAIELARRLIAAGELGEIAHFRARYLQDWGWDAPHGWHHEQRLAGTGAIGDYCHLIDLAHHLVGDIARLSADTLRLRSDRNDASGASRPVTVEDAYVASGRFAAGALLSLEASRAATGRKAQQWVEINGERGSLWWDMEDLNHLHVFRAADGDTAGFRRVLVTEPQHPFLSDWWPTGHTLGWEHTLVHQWHGLDRALASGKAPAVPQASFRDGLRADVVVHALAAAAAQGTRMEISYDATPDATGTARDARPEYERA